MDVSCLVERVLTEGAPQAAPERERWIPAAWLVRLFVRLTTSVDGQHLAPLVSQAVLENLASGSARTRALALVFFHYLPYIPGAERIDELAAGDRAGFAGIPDPTASRRRTLEDRLMEAVHERHRRRLT
jgi:hypothetical protein